MKAVFLDRDGLINRQAEPHMYICKWEDFVFLDGVFDALRLIHEAGYLTIIITNQRGIARGMLTEDELAAIHKAMCSEIEARGGRIDAIYVCPHDIGQCHCRKPDIGLFLRAESDFDIDKAQAWMIGDSDSDVEAGARYGVRTIKTASLISAIRTILEAGQ